jgi:hypothetical protein
MKTRGRNSTASRLIAGNFGERPEPLSNLTKRQKAIWQEVVAGEDPAFFSTAVLRGFLGDYCRRRDSCEQITVVIDGFGAGWQDDAKESERLDRLLKMRDREIAGMVTLATKLRLTNQSRFFPDVAARAAAKASKDEQPWRRSA